MEQIDAEAQCVAAPAQVSVAPAANTFEHRRNVRVGRLFEGVALDRAAVLPFVFVPFVSRGDDRMQRHQAGIDACLDVAPMVEKFIRDRLQMRQVVHRRRLGPEAVTDKNIAAGASPLCEPAADAGKATREPATA